MISLKDFKAAVAAERQKAKDHARSLYKGGCLFSRGTFIATVNKHGQCKPLPEAEAINWNGTLRELNQVYEQVQRDYPDVTEIYVAGGYDWAESPKAMQEGDYDPWASEWNVVWWTRPNIMLEMNKLLLNKPEDNAGTAGSGVPASVVSRPQPPKVGRVAKLTLAVSGRVFYEITDDGSPVCAGGPVTHEVARKNAAGLQAKLDPNGSNFSFDEITIAKDIIKKAVGALGLDLGGGLNDLLLDNMPSLADSKDAAALVLTIINKEASHV